MTINKEVPKQTTPNHSQHRHHHKPVNMTNLREYYFHYFPTDLIESNRLNQDQSKNSSPAYTPDTH